MTSCYDGQAISDIAAGKFLQKFSSIMSDTDGFLLGYEDKDFKFDADTTDLIALLYQ